MSWFGPKLEPGERVVWRYPEAFTRLGWTVIVVLAMASGAATFAIDAFGPLGVDGLTAIRVIGAGLFTLIFLSQIRTWRCLVTGQRVLVRRGPFWRKSFDVPLEDIEVSQADSIAGHIVAQGTGEKIRLPLTPEELPALQEAIERAKSGIAAA